MIEPSKLKLKELDSIFAKGIQKSCDDVLFVMQFDDPISGKKNNEEIYIGPPKQPKSLIYPSDRLERLIRKAAAHSAYDYCWRFSE